MKQRNRQFVTTTAGQTRVAILCLAIFGLASTGCSLTRPCHPPLAVEPMVREDTPRELSKGILPMYTIEPPDVLVIEAINIVPQAPYHLRATDVLSIGVRGTLPDAPIAGPFQVDPGGQINLGPPYDTLKVAGMTVAEARKAIEMHLNEVLKEPQVAVSLLEMAAKQQISGDHLVGPDGTVTLGSYGSVQVVGQTLAEAKASIEEYLSKYLEQPEVSVNVFSYNSKVYYIVMQGAGLGDGLFRFPITGNETVLDAIAQINGLEQSSSKRIWIARPGHNHAGCDQILPVDWQAITQLGDVASNYQVLPGDRVYISEDKFVAFDTKLAKFTAPFERIFGFTLLGTGAVTRLSGHVLKGGGNPRAGTGGG